MDPELQKQITTVQNILGKYVKKPPLADKHLVRPPFRFLHDILVAVLNATGFYGGLFTPAEIDSSALNTKEEKTEFLTKALRVTGLATGSKVDAKVGKILAGQDPEKTLEFLILLGGALDRGVNSKEAVATVIGGGENKKSDAKASKPKEKTSSNEGGAGKVKEKDIGGAKKSSQQSTKAIPQGQQSSSNQKPARQSEKEKQKASNVKSNSTTKAKSPASKDAKPEDPKVRSGEEKRERSRSRDDGKRAPAPVQQTVRRDSKSKEKGATQAETRPPLTKIPSKEDMNRSSAKNPQQSSSRDQSMARTEVITEDQIEAEVTQPPQVDMETQDTLVNNEDSVQFMGEVESLLQEHGIQIEAEEKRKQSSAERKQSAGEGKPSADVPTAGNSEQVKDKPIDQIVELESNVRDNILITPSKTPEPIKSVTQLTRLTSAAKTNLSPAIRSDESDVDTDDSEVGPLATAKRNSGPIRKQPEPGSSEGESGRNVPPSAMRRPPSSFTRPTSARPAPPRPKTAIVEEETIYRPPTTKIPVILDSEEIEEEESAESRKQGLLDLLVTQPIPNTGPIGSGVDVNAAQARGHLVQQIMETKRELEAGDKSKDGDMGNLRKQSQGELEALKGLIQSSARLANPLARILDFLQEDIDAMTSEYIKYQTEDKKLRDLLEKEKEITRQRLKPKRLELMELMDKLEQQNFEIRAAHNDLAEVEEHLRNYITSIDAGPERVDIPTRFMVKNEWEFDLDTAAEEHDDLEKRAKNRSGAFGEFPPFLCVSAEAREAEKAGGKGFNIPKIKRKAHQAGNPNLMRKDFKKPSFAIESSEDGLDSDRRGFFGQGKSRFTERRRSSQFLEPPEPELDSLEILSEK